MSFLSDIAAYAGDMILGPHRFLQSLAPLLAVLAGGLGLFPVLQRKIAWHRLLVVVLVGLVTVKYYAWRVSNLAMASHDGTGGWLAWLVFGVEILAILEVSSAVLMLSRTVNRSPEADRAEARMAASGIYPMVDVFIPTYNEGLEVLEKTILGALALDWPAGRFKVWVLDDKKRDWLKDYCALKGAGYLTRADNSHAKAGNINAALKLTDGEFVAVFDADFVPRPNFLKRTVGLFENPKIGIVQTPHHFYNSDPVQTNLLMNGMLPDDQRMFFDVIMPSRDAWDAAFCCGSCGVLRRTAVEAIGGGIPTSSVTEDILTTLAMKRAGYITRFLDEKLAFGLAAESVEAFFVQRERWARGGIQLVFLKEGPLGPGLGLIDRIMFFPLAWVIQYMMRVFGFALPTFCLWTGFSPMPGVTSLDIVAEQFPFLIAFFFMARWFAPGHHVPLLTGASQCFASFRMTPSVIASLIKPFGVLFRVTPKGNAAGGPKLDKRTFFLAGAFMAATIAGLVINLYSAKSIGVFAIVAMWSFWNAIVLGLVMIICFEVPRRRAEERFPAKEDVLVSATDPAFNGWVLSASARDYSLSGARLFVDPVAICQPIGEQTTDVCTAIHGQNELSSTGPISSPDVATLWRAGENVKLWIEDVGSVAATIVDNRSGWMRVSFDWDAEKTPVEIRDRMIVKLFASGRHAAGLKPARISDMMKAALQRVFGQTWLEQQPRTSK